MNIHYGVSASLLLLFVMNPLSAAGLDRSSKRFLLDREGGAIEIEASSPEDKQTRDSVREQLRKDARSGVPAATAAMKELRKKIKYRFEKTPRGGRIRIIAKNQEALLAVQQFLRTQMSNSTHTVAFDFIDNTSLVVVPVTINNHGPYKFLLDTGASNTILSSVIADKLGIATGRTERLLTAAGDVPVTVRTVKSLQTGGAQLQDVEIAVGNFPLMKTLNVDGILGADYLRRFKISIDYDNQIVDIEPFAPEAMSMLVA